MQSYLENLINEGRLDAVLVPATKPEDSVLRFGQSSGDRTGEADSVTEAELIAAKQRCEALDLHMQIAQRRMEMSREYIDAERKVRKSRAEGGDVVNGVDGPLSSQPVFEFPDEDALEEL